MEEPHHGKRTKNGTKNLTGPQLQHKTPPPEINVAKPPRRKEKEGMGLVKEKVVRI